MSWLGCDLLYFTLHYNTLHYINIQFLYTWCVTREEPHPKLKRHGFPPDNYVQFKDSNLMALLGTP